MEAGKDRKTRGCELTESAQLVESAEQRVLSMLMLQNEILEEILSVLESAAKYGGKHD